MLTRIAVLVSGGGTNLQALLDAENIPRHGSKPGTRAEAAAAAGEG